MRAALVLALGLCACTPEAAPAEPVFEVRAVVQPRIAVLEAALEPIPAFPPPTDEAREELEAILGPLRSGAARMRELAIEDARGLSEAAVGALLASLNDPAESPEVRLGLAEILGARATPATLEALCAALETAPEPWLRAQCAYRLGLAASDVFLPRLLLRLKYEKDLEVAFWIADAVSRLRHLAGVEGMLVVWSSTPDENVRATAGQRLYELAQEYGQTDAGELVRRWRAGELSGPTLEPSPRLVLEAWRWIGRLGEWNLRTVDDARFVLSRSEAWVVPLLAEALHESDVHVRVHVAQCLERLGKRARTGAPGDRLASNELVAALAEPRTAPAAAAALGALGDPIAATALERCLERSPDPELRVAAARALAALEQTSSAAVLRRAFTDAAEVDLRQAAAQALIAIQDEPDALAFVRACLTDERADAGAAELALGTWLARRAEREAGAARAALERWRALDPAASDLPSDEELRTRRDARAEIVRTLAP